MSDPSNTMPRRRRRRRTILPTLAPAALLLCIALIGGTIGAIIFRILEVLT